MHHRAGWIGWGAALFVTGAALGAGTALLLAPRDGRATRREIGRFVRRTRGKAERTAEDFAARVKEMAESVGERATGILEVGKDMTRDARHKVVKAVEEAAERLGHEKDRLLKLAG